MSFEERLTWVGAVVAIVVPVAHFWIVLGRLGETPAAEIAYQWPLIIAIAASSSATTPPPWACFWRWA
jgi:hypothetical protein